MYRNNQPLHLLGTMTARTDNPLILKLESGVSLSEEDRQRLEALCSASQKVPARRDIISEGHEPDFVHLVMDGLAYRYKLLDDGRRSIVAFLVPGDFCDLNVAILGKMDHSIGALEQSNIVKIPRHTIEELLFNFPRITKALWWATLVDEGTLREWLVNMGRRPTDKQMAHLFCELYVRMNVVGKVQNGSFPFPLTQDDLADTLGLSTVHTNRTLQRLRELGLIQFANRYVTIGNFQALAEFAEFEPAYLHLRQR